MAEKFKITSKGILTFISYALLLYFVLARSCFLWQNFAQESKVFGALKVVEIKDIKIDAKILANKLHKTSKFQHFPFHFYENFLVASFIVFAAIFLQKIFTQFLTKNRLSYFLGIWRSRAPPVIC